MNFGNILRLFCEQIVNFSKLRFGGSCGQRQCGAWVAVSSVNAMHRLFSCCRGDLQISQFCHAKITRRTPFTAFLSNPLLSLPNNCLAKLYLRTTSEKPNPKSLLRKLHPLSTMVCCLAWKSASPALKLTETIRRTICLAIRCMIAKATWLSPVAFLFLT